MPTGFQVLNTTGIVQIDENFKNPRFVTSGTIAERNSSNQGNWFTLELGAYGIDLTNEIPVVLIRPTQYGQYIGSIAVSAMFVDQSINAITFPRAQNYPYEYAIFSTLVAGVVDPGGTVGLQVFKADGSLVYNSNNRHPRILANLYKPAQPSYPYPYSFFIAAQPETPWFLANPLLWSTWGAEDDQVTGIFMRLDSPSQVTIGHQFTEQPETSVVSVLGVNGAIPLDPYNKHVTNIPYTGRDATFAIATYS